MKQPTFTLTALLRALLVALFPALDHTDKPRIIRLERKP